MGFKYFVQGLLGGSFCFGGEESAGACFLRRDGSVWTTDKDGFIMNLLAAEITARTGKDPGEHYRELTAQFGPGSAHRRAGDARAQSAAGEPSPDDVERRRSPASRSTRKLTKAPGNDAPSAA